MNKLWIDQLDLVIQNAADKLEYKNYCWEDFLGLSLNYLFNDLNIKDS